MHILLTNKLQSDYKGFSSNLHLATNAVNDISYVNEKHILEILFILL